MGAFLRLKTRLALALFFVCLMVSVAFAEPAGATIINDAISYVAFGLIVAVGGLITVGMQRLAQRWKLNIPQAWMDSVQVWIDHGIHYAEEWAHQKVSNSETVAKADKLNQAASFVLAMTDDKKLLKMGQEQLKQLIEARLSKMRANYQLERPQPIAGIENKLPGSI